MNVDHFGFILPSEITEKKKIKIRKQICEMQQFDVLLQSTCKQCYVW